MIQPNCPEVASGMDIADPGGAYNPPSGNERTV